MPWRAEDPIACGVIRVHVRLSFSPKQARRVQPYNADVQRLAQGETLLREDPTQAKRHGVGFELCDVGAKVVQVVANWLGPAFREEAQFRQVAFVFFLALKMPRNESDGTIHSKITLSISTTAKLSEIGRASCRERV